VSRRTLGRGALGAFALAAFALGYWRLYYGVDFTDEAWYVAVPYRFVLGGRPYVDELSVPQTTTAVVLYPFVWAYHALAGRTGIVLFVRQLHFLIATAVGVAVGVSLRRVAGLGIATLAGVAAFAFVPFDIPSVSYDSLGSGLFTAGTLLGFLALSRPRARLWAGICLGLAAFAYPPLLLAVAASCALRLLLARGGRRGEALVALPALAIPVLGFGALVALAGLHQVVSDYRRSSRFLGQAGGVTKLHLIATHLGATTFPLWYLAAAGLALLALSWARGWGRIAALLVVALPLTVLPPRLTTFSTSLDFVAHVGFVALPLLGGLWRRREAVELFVAVWVPALLAGLLTSYSSANGGVNFGVGFFPAVIVTLVFSAWSIDELVATRLPFELAPALIVATLLLYVGIVPVYRDAGLSTLHARVTAGPYAGLFTNRAKRSFLGRLGRDLAGVNAGCTIAFFDDFPAGYLLTPARPDTNAVWTATVPRRLTFAYHQDLVRYYDRHGFPDVVVLMRRIPFALPRSARRERYKAADPLIVAIRSHGYRRSARRIDYVVYRRSTC